MKDNMAKNLMRGLREANTLLDSTVSVKLRYESIIKKILQKSDSDDQNLNVRKIISDTPINKKETKKVKRRTKAAEVSTLATAVTFGRTK